MNPSWYDIDKELDPSFDGRILNLGMNKLTNLPRGFGSFPIIEILDLSYNNLSENSLPTNFFIMETLRALYLRYRYNRIV